MTFYINDKNTQMNLKYHMTDDGGKEGRGGLKINFSKNKNKLGLNTIGVLRGV